MICLRCRGRLGCVLFFFNIYDARLSGPETPRRICMIRLLRITEGAKTESRTKPECGPSMDNMGMTACSVVPVAVVVAMFVGAPVFIPVLSLMVILFVIIIFPAVAVGGVVARVVPSAIKASIEPTIVPVKSYCRSSRDQPEQGDDQA